MNKIRNKNISKKKIAFLIFFLLAFLIMHTTVISTVEKYTNVTVEFGSEFEEDSSREAILKNIQNQNQSLNPDEFIELPKPSPFSEIDIFDDDAKDWSSFFDGYAPTGVLVFDANGDSRLDVYFCRNGNSWVRPTDENAVLLDEPYPQYNSLYMNMGNDGEGNPIYEQAKNLAAINDTYVQEELLVENYLFPRKSVKDSQKRIGRASSIAIAVDINNDGRLDLIVANILPGMLWSHPKTQRVLGQFVRPVGRQAVRAKLPLSAQGLYFIKDYKASDQTNVVRKSSRGIESVGANSTFLNMGDKDGDGLPEWRDVSREIGLEGKRNTMALLAADFDLDGDIDIFEANIMDMDYWPGGAAALAGAANQLYINQLVETGNLTFIERSASMDVDGVYDDKNPVPNYYRLYKIPVLPEEYSIAMLKFEKYQPDFLEINGESSENGQISWAAVTHDVNDDGYPDIWVANDLGFLRLYLNDQGKKFKLSMDHPRANQTGYWMSLSPADFNGDLKEDLFAGNIGGASMNLAMPLPDIYSLFDPVMSACTIAQQFFGKSHHSMHSIIDGSDFRLEIDNKVRHSRILPPDASLENNIRDFVTVDAKDVEFDRESLDPYEFTWGSTIIDIQNDGKQDLYWVGCLQGRGGGTFPIMGTGPGRLLVNATKYKDKLRFVDLTAEHHLFNIHELKYDRLESDGYIYRESPLQNWGKRSMVYSHDVSVWGFHGPGIVERISNHDLIQTAENGRAAVAADLNNDGFADIMVRNIGGYDSRSSKAENLKARLNGKIEVIPAHDANFPTPTNYEPGSTRVFINTYRKNNWIKVQLINDSEESYNRNAVGAQLIINNKYIMVNRSGTGGFISNYFGPLLFGLNKEVATTVEVRWPDKKRTVTKLKLPDYNKGLITISKTEGVVSWIQFKESN